ncbi:MAG TPA: hypothetical protein VMF03_10495 [Steroidobacteraceae bacterium]|nr:hypothetical protein [Steroidobacteraceae bacterium]
MPEQARTFLKSMAFELPLYVVVVSAYIVLVLRYLAQPLHSWFASQRVLYAGAALVLIIGQGLVLDFVTFLVGRAIGALRRR